MSYYFRFSKTVMIITALGILALGILLYFLLFHSDKSMYDLIGWGVIIALLYPIASMPIYIKDDGDTLLLKRLLWTKLYQRSEYTIEQSSEANLKGTIRVFGSGGYFGFIGFFYKPKMGLFRLIQTESTGSYLIVKKKDSSQALYIAYN